MGSKPKKPPENKIKRPGGFYPVCREWFNSESFRDLSLKARCLLHEFQNVHQPGRNGYLSISVLNAAKRLGVDPKTARKPFHELAEHGFITLTKGEYWQERKAREWRLTFYGCNGKEATDEWRFWGPGEPVVRVPKKVPAIKKAEGKSSPRIRKSGGEITSRLDENADFMMEANEYSSTYSWSSVIA
jgi:hypothetical protein